MQIGVHVCGGSTHDMIPVLVVSWWLYGQKNINVSLCFSWNICKKNV